MVDDSGFETAAAPSSSSEVIKPTRRTVHFAPDVPAPLSAGIDDKTADAFENAEPHRVYAPKTLADVLASKIINDGSFRESWYAP